MHSVITRGDSSNLAIFRLILEFITQICMDSKPDKFLFQITSWNTKKGEIWSIHIADVCHKRIPLHQLILR
jgi:hypothetical protein